MKKSNIGVCLIQDKISNWTLGSSYYSDNLKVKYSTDLFNVIKKMIKKSNENKLIERTGSILALRQLITDVYNKCDYRMDIRIQDISYINSIQDLLDKYGHDSFNVANSKSITNDQMKNRFGIWKDDTLYKPNYDAKIVINTGKKEINIVTIYYKIIGEHNV